MNNLHRQLAPISDAAWDQIEDEARRTFKRWIAGRRVVDVVGPCGDTLAAVPTGHMKSIAGEGLEGVETWQREVHPVIQMRVPFTLSRAAIDDVDRGAQDSDWQPVKDAVRQIALAEDRTIFHGAPALGITGIKDFTSNKVLTAPSEIRDFPDAVASAMTELRLAGVNGPYALLLSADLYTAVSETTDHGYPVREHLSRQVGGDIIWAPAIDGAILLTTRGGDYALHIGQDLSIGYLSHTDTEVTLYHQESITFLPFTSEASVTIKPA